MADTNELTTGALGQYLDGTGLSQVWDAIVAKFVAQEAGKGLSANDLTDTLLAKLNGIADGAQVNVIESVKVNNAAVEIANKTINITVPTGTLANLNEVAEENLSEALANLINGKVDKVEGMGLSHNDYDDAAVAEVAKVKDKVDKVEGMGLSHNDYDDAAVAEVAKVSGKADKASSLAGYGIEDAYTKTETDSKISSMYKFLGSINFSQLPTEDIEDHASYNIKDAFTTTDDFEEGAGLDYPAGTNVAWVAADQKWDCLAGTYDFSNFMMKDDIRSLTSDEIANICK